MTAATSGWLRQTETVKPIGSTAAQRAAALARYYDLDVIDVDYDAELYQEFAQTAGGPVLEMAVGSGRLAIPLALGGYEVIGIDNDSAMVERARSRWDAVRGSIEAQRFQVVESDFRSFRSEMRFGLVFIAINTFLLLEGDDAKLALLRTMRQHLRDGGIAIAEMSIPDEDELESYDGRLQLEWLRTDRETGDEVTKSMAARHDDDADTVELIQIYESTPRHGGVLSRVVKTDLLHLISADRLVELAREAGFGEVRLLWDHLATPSGAASHRAVLVARKV